MLRIIIIVLCCSATSIGYAENWGIKCAALALQAGNPDDRSYPPFNASATHDGRVYVYEAPSEYCRVKGQTVTKGDVLSLAVNSSFEAWVNVTHSNENNGWSGWVSRSNIKAIIDMNNPGIKFEKSGNPNAMTSGHVNSSGNEISGR